MTDAELTELIASYRPSEAASTIVRSASIVLLVGITGAGKNTLKQELLKDDSFYDFISHTTRQPRSNLGVMEQDGIDYYFIDSSEAARMLRAGEFIEAKKVHSNVYGTAIEGLAPSVESGKVAVNDVDVQGVEEYKAISPAVHAVFVLPPSFDEWNTRRLARYGDAIDPEDNKVRLESAKAELDFALSSGLFDFIVNDDVSSAADHVRALVSGRKLTAHQSEAEAVARSLYESL
jgi:guanylate kinase